MRSFVVIIISACIIFSGCSTNQSLSTSKQADNTSVDIIYQNISFKVPALTEIDRRSDTAMSIEYPDSMILSMSTFADFPYGASETYAKMLYENMVTEIGGMSKKAKFDEIIETVVGDNTAYEINGKFPLSGGPSFFKGTVFQVESTIYYIFIVEDLQNKKQYVEQYYALVNSIKTIDDQNVITRKVYLNEEICFYYFKHLHNTFWV